MDASLFLPDLELSRSCITSLPQSLARQKSAYVFSHATRHSNSASGLGERYCSPTRIPRHGGVGCKPCLHFVTQLRPRACRQERHEGFYVMSLGKVDALINKKRLDVFLDALLGVKTNSIRRTFPAQLQCVSGRLQIVFRPDDPLPDYREHPLIAGHTTPCLHAQRGAQSCRRRPCAKRTPQAY